MGRQAGEKTPTAWILLARCVFNVQKSFAFLQLLDFYLKEVSSLPSHTCAGSLKCHSNTFF